MKKTFTIAAALLALVIGTNVQAQEVKKFSLGIGVEGALPTGGLSNLYSVGGGLTLRAAFGLDESSAFTVTSGALAFAPKDLSYTNDLKAQINIPVKAGYKYFFGGNFYGIAEAGMSFIKTYVPDMSGGTTSVSNSEFTYAPGVGVQFGSFDASVRYEAYSGAGFLGLRAGFNF